jgi:histone acetyltransferase
MKKHKSAWPFIEAVQLEDVPDYHLIIKEPMDIKTIERKLQGNEYENKQ